MIERVKQRHLRCFVEIVRWGSLTKAAEGLAITQSAASKSLRELEGIVGERLLERGRGGVSLTPAGEILHRYASASLTAIRQGVDLLSHARQDARRAVLLGVLPNTAAEIMPDAVAAFKLSHPTVPVRIFTGTNSELLTRLRMGELDFVAGRLGEPQDMMGLHFERLYDQALALVARPEHPLLGMGSFDLQAIRDFILIIPLRDTVIRRETDRFLIGAGLTHLSNTIETLSTPFARRFTRQTDALWMTPHGAVAADLADGQLRQLPVDLAVTENAVGLSTRGQAGVTPLTAALMREVRAVCHRRGFRGDPHAG